MSSGIPKAGDAVKVTLLNGDVVEGTVEWIDTNGAYVKGAQKSRWVPLESFLAQPTLPLEAKREKEAASEE